MGLSENRKAADIEARVDTDLHCWRITTASPRFAGELSIKVDAALQAENARLRTVVAALVKAWPSVIRHPSGKYYLSGGVTDGPWGVPEGPYPTREAAVFTAAGLDPEGEPCGP